MNDDLSSEFEFDADAVERKRRRLDLATKDAKSTTKRDKDACNTEWNKEDRMQKFLAIDPYSRHKLLINQYLLNHAGATDILKRDTSRDRTDVDFIKANHKFLWSDTDESTSWGAKLAKRYYDKLFKEYCISDLSRYKEKKIAMRWRTEQEVINGKGQFVCGDKKCNEKDGLASWEVNFGYVENGEKKNALVKLRLCPECSHKLNYYHQKRKITKKPKQLGTVGKIKTEPLSESEHSPTSKTRSNPNIETESGGEAMTSSSSRDQNRDSTLSSANGDNEIWTKPVELEEDKKREDEFEDFLEDLLM